MRRTVSVLALALGFAGATALSATQLPAGAADTVPFSITVAHINCLDPCDEEGLEDLGEDTPDFYVKVWINGVKLPDPPRDEDEPSSPTIDDHDSIDPNWVITAQIPADLVRVPVAIQVWDHDSTSGDDLADISPHGDGDSNLDYVFDRSNNTWSGDVDQFSFPKTCSEGNGDQPRVRICLAGPPDRDGDGLLDLWETQGFDANGDGSPEVDLPAMKANPDHKDLFLELDYVAGASPSRASIEAIRKAFAAAPIDAGSRAGERQGAQGPNKGTFGVSAPPNPDGKPGITLHVDTGTLYDTGATEGQAPGTCADGADNGAARRGFADGTDGGDTDCVYLDASVEDPRPNCGNGADDDGDGLADAADPDCLVGDPVFAQPGMGGGRALSVDPQACGLDAEFYKAKNSTEGLAQARRLIFRYAISDTIGNDASGKPCPSSGGQGEIGGNDFVEFNHDGGTIMHELGHTLNLHHGGDVDDNCKPNYVSVMNYNLQSGIPRAFGGSILDYSAPRISLDGGVRGIPLDKLDENSLDENPTLDPVDNANISVFTNEKNKDAQFQLNSHPNWNGDDDTSPGAGYENDVTANIDDDGTDGSPSACNNTKLGPLNGADDWPFVSLSFVQFGEASDAAIRPVPDPEPTLTELTDNVRSFNATDLSVNVADQHDPVAAGTDLTYDVTVRNLGINPAHNVEVVQTLPSGFILVSSSAGCGVVAGKVACILGELGVGATRTMSVTVHVPADLVYVNGGPLDVTSTTTVTNLAGADVAPADNSDTETTRVVAVADAKVDSAIATSPLEVLMGQAATASLAVTVANGGPSSPVDTLLTTSASGDPGITVGGTGTTPQSALTATPRVVVVEVSLACTSPGSKSVTLTASIQLKNAEDTDSDPTNNVRVARFTVDCVVPIAVNVRPGDYPNSINLNTDATVAALTTTAGEYNLPLPFDATKIDARTVRWGLRGNLFNTASPTGAKEIHNTVHLVRSYELDERTKDADLDGVMHFKPSESGLTPQTTEACVKGRYTAPGGNTYTFLGCDSVRVIN